MPIIHVTVTNTAADVRTEVNINNIEIFKGVKKHHVFWTFNCNMYIILYYDPLIIHDTKYYISSHTCNVLNEI